MSITFRKPAWSTPYQRTRKAGASNARQGRDATKAGALSASLDQIKKAKEIHEKDRAALLEGSKPATLGRLFLSST